MYFRYAVAVGSLFVMASGCAYLPEGHSSRVIPESPARLFVDDIDNEGVPIAAPKVAAAPEGAGLRVRKSKRGNMESYVVRGQRYFTLTSANEYSAKGTASWYGPNFHGRTASNGEVYDMYRLTAAHKTLPLPTYVRVTHLENGRSVVVKVNDRGPFSGDRIIDLSFAAALRLGMINDGTGEVEVQALSPEELMVLSGPDNRLDVDFYYADAEGEEVSSAIAQGEPKQSTKVRPTEVADAVAVGIGQTPIFASDSSVSVGSGQVAGQAADQAASQVASQAAVEAEVQSATAEPTDALLDDEIQVVAAPLPVPEPLLVKEPLPVNEEGGRLIALNEAIDEAPGADLQDALLPVVGEVSVQGLTAPAALQTVSGGSAPDQRATVKDRDGYYIQAGVYARVSDAERVAVDVVLASQGEEEVNVKPLKDSLMYRVTVGPIVTSEHAAKVSRSLFEAGLENFTVRVD